VKEYPLSPLNTTGAPLLGTATFPLAPAIVDLAVPVWRLLKTAELGVLVPIVVLLILLPLMTVFWGSFVVMSLLRTLRIPVIISFNEGFGTDPDPLFEVLITNVIDFIFRFVFQWLFSF